MKVRRTLFALTVASLALWPGLTAAQALLSAPELVLPRTRFEITLSGFDRDSRTLADTPPRSSVTQKEERVSAALEFGLGPLFLGGGGEQTDSVTETLTETLTQTPTETLTATLAVQEETTISRENFFAALVLFDLLRPYLRRETVERSNLLTIFSTTLVTNLATNLASNFATTLRINLEEKLTVSSAGITIRFSFNGFIPFLGYARGAEELAILTNITALPVIAENFDYATDFFEAGFVFGDETGFNGLLVYRTKENPRVPGVQVSLAAATAESGEARLGYGFGNGSGISLGYSQSTSGREFENLSSFSEEEDQTTVVFQVNETWLLRVSQADVLRNSLFSLVTPAIRTQNRFKRTALTVQWNF